MSTPRGFLLIAGPDGAGKSTVADAIEAQARRLGVTVSRVHHRPGVLRPGDPSIGPVTDPHREPPWSPPLAVAKLLAVLIDFILGAPRWRRQAETGLLILERGWWDLTVDPRRYRLPWWLVPLARLLGRFTPRADLVVMLEGDPDVLAARKGEIDATETDRQIQLWRGLLSAAGRRQLTLDTTATDPEEAAATVLEKLDRAGRRWRRVPLAAQRLDLRASGLAGPAFTIHRPFSPLARVGAAVGRAMFRFRLTPTCPPPFPDLDDLLLELEIEVDGLVAFRSSGRGRWIVGSALRGRPTAVAKIGPAEDPGLRNEAEVLEQLSGRTEGFDIPRLRINRSWRDRFVLVTDARTTQHAATTLADAATIATELTRGLDGMGPIVHGDLAPWNVDRDEDGRLYVFDWEEARSEWAPLHDLSHFVVRAGSLLGKWTPQQATEVLTAPGSLGVRHLRDLGIPAERAKDLVTAYLDRTTPGSQDESTYRDQVRRALADHRLG